MLLRIMYVGIVLGVASAPVNCLQKNSIFIIEIKKTGMVLEDHIGDYRVSEWSNSDSQLWILEEQYNSESYLLRNVKTRSTIGCTKEAKFYEMWKLNIYNYTRIHLEPPGYFLGIENNTLKCLSSEQSDGNDKWLIIEPPKKLNTKFVIKNTKTGKVLEEVEASLQVKSWKNIDSQLWTLKPQNKSQYSIANVASGNILTYSKNGTEYQTWRFKTYGNTRIQVEPFNVFLADKNGEAVVVKHKLSDNSDKWTLTDPESMENKKPRRIYVDDYNEELVIENKKTSNVLDASKLIEEYRDKDTQLWTLEEQNVSGSYIIRNLGDGSILTYTDDVEEYQTWKLNVTCDTRIRPETTNFFLADVDGRAVGVKEKNDKSDKWVLVERSLKKENMKPKRIYVNADSLVQ